MVLQAKFQRILCVYSQDDDGEEYDETKVVDISLDSFKNLEYNEDNALTTNKDNSQVGQVYIDQYSRTPIKQPPSMIGFLTA